MHHYTECGLDNVYLSNGFKITESASGTGISVHDLDGLYVVIGKSLEAKSSPLSPKEFRFLRVELDLSQKAVAGLMEKSDQTIAKWEKGDVKIPILADKAIRDLYMESIGEGHTAGLLKKLASVDRKLHELIIRIEETDCGWNQVEDAA